MQEILITGANRGLGLELCRSYLGRGARVHAVCRAPEHADELRSLEREASGLQIHRLDLAELEDIDTLDGQLGEASIDVLINNAGVLGPAYAEQRIGQLDYASWTRTLRINALAPMRLLECLAHRLERSRRGLVVNVSSTLASMSEPSFPGLHIYRSSKALLNSITVSAARELEPRGIHVVAIHPGLADTRMGDPSAPSAREIVERMLPTLEALGAEHSGRFLNWDGSPHPW